MIDTPFIVRYTNGLYTTDAGSAPRFDEFRDMFSGGQMASKEWAVKTLGRLQLPYLSSAVIVGAWFGTLGLMLSKVYPEMIINLLDIDPRCNTFLKNITYDLDNVSTETGDMYAYEYIEDLVVNTSCEHIPDIAEWLRRIPVGTYVMLQSNNFYTAPGHINCVSRLEDFELQTKLSTILYAGQLDTKTYTRYMIIGQV